MFYVVFGDEMYTSQHERTLFCFYSILKQLCGCITHNKDSLQTTYMKALMWSFI